MVIRSIAAEQIILRSTVLKRSIVARRTDFNQPALLQGEHILINYI